MGWRGSAKTVRGWLGRYIKPKLSPFMTYGWKSYDVSPSVLGGEERRATMVI